ncbi:hypothetical protein SAMN05216337_104048 [Bradyrhizobium brasilense]|uniref:Uncharacterized protein n=1 Tax=Bradyrhizobium brasilense TaxID=1419277 RepID=A0A1G7H522_9BRAD|nr:hypothetical protein SAMN05216337_104048 [Bradyrhizobium brasilense]
MIGRSALAVYKHFTEQDLRVHDPGVGGALEPGSALGSVFRDTSAFNQYPTIPVLGSRDTHCSTTQPHCGLGIVRLDPDAFSKADGEVEGGNEITRFGSAFEPITSLRLVAGLTAAAKHEIRKVDFRLFVTEFNRTLQPESGKVRIAADGGADGIELTQRSRSWRVTSFSGALEPGYRFDIVRRQLASACVQQANMSGCFSVAGKCCPAQPGFSFDQIALDTVAIDEGNAQAPLREAYVLVGGMTIQLECSSQVGSRAYTEFGERSDKIESGGNARRRRLRNLLKRLSLRPLVLCPAKQGEAKAEASLRTAGFRGARVPALGCRHIGDGIGTGS